MKDPLKIEAFADWCERQDADAQYDYCDNCECATALFLKDAGIGDPVVGTKYWSDGVLGTEYRIKREIDDACVDFPRTFGALASRLREFIRKAA